MMMPSPSHAPRPPRTSQEGRESTIVERVVTVSGKETDGATRTWVVDTGGVVGLVATSSPESDSQCSRKSRSACLRLSAQSIPRSRAERALLILPRRPLLLSTSRDGFLTEPGV